VELSRCPSYFLPFLHRRDFYFSFFFFFFIFLQDNVLYFIHFSRDLDVQLSHQVQSFEDYLGVLEMFGFPLLAIFASRLSSILILAHFVAS